ncbi:MAG: glycosyltransferase family 9 protein [Leptospirillia bacterium]
MTRSPISLPARDDIRRILILKWSAMGDVVIATAVMEDVARAFPDAEIDLNTLPPWDRMFAHDPRFSKVIAPDLRGGQGGIKGTLNWLGIMRRGRYDLVIDLQSNDRSRLLLGLLTLIGPKPRWRLGIHDRFPYNISPGAIDPKIHAHEGQKLALAAAGIPTVTDRPRLYPADGHVAHAKEIMAEHGLTPGAYAIFLPGSQAAGYLKRWGAARYAALAEKLRAAGLEKSVLIGGPDETDECDAIEKLGGDAIVNLCGKTHLLEIVPIVDGAKLVVGNDTGTAHIAAASGKPMTIVCGPTDPARVKPVGPRVKTLQADLDCINCYCKAPCDHHSCMLEITPDMVLESLDPALRVPS